MTSALSRKQRGLAQRSMDLIGFELWRLRCPPQLQDELQSCGYEALVSAALEYDEQRRVPFRAYARQRLRWALADYLRQIIPGGRGRQRLMQAIDAHHHRREDIDEAWLARAQLRLGSMSLLGPCCAYTDHLEATEQQDWMSRLIAQDHAQRCEQFAAHLLATLPPQERSIIEAVYRHEATLSDIARDLGKSPSALSRRHAQILDKLRAMTPLAA